MILTDKATNKKLYPVCKFEENQHRLDWFITLLKNEIHEDLDEGCFSEAKQERLEYLEKLLEEFNAGVYKDGLVYMTYEKGQEVKELINEYKLRHIH